MYPLTVCILVAAILAAYGNSFRAPFTFDDLDNFVNRSSMKWTALSLANLERTTRDNLHRNRVLPNISFGLNYYFGRGDVRGYHLVNVVIHIANALLLYALFIRLLSLNNTLSLPGPPVSEVAFFAALIWALHPLQTNGVTYLVQRMTSMAALFYLASLLAYLAARTSPGGPGRRLVLFATAFSCGILALLSKETSVLLPFMILACELFFLRRAEGGAGRGRLVTGLVLALFLLGLAAWLYTGPDLVEHLRRVYEQREFTLVERLLTQSRVIFYYLGLIVLPLPSRLNLNHDFPLSRALTDPPQTLLALAGILLLCVLIVGLYRNHRLWSFALLWFLANLLLESTVIPLEIIYEHRLYLPAVMLFVAATATLYRLWRGRQTMLRLGLLFCAVLLAVGTWQRNTVWADNITFWQDVARKSPRLTRPYEHLSSAYLDAKRDREAYDICAAALRHQVSSVHIYNNWGKAAVNLGRVDEGVRLLEVAVRLDPSNGESHYNLGVAYGMQGRSREARREMILGMRLMGEFRSSAGQR